MDKTVSSDELIEQYMVSLKRCGFRLTPQRRLIVRTLIENMGKHPNAQELLQMVQSEDPSVGIATVYRTVEILSQIGLLSTMNMEEGFSRFEIRRNSVHFHAFCRYCGKIINLGGEKEKEATIKEWIKPTGFQLLPQTFEISGICGDCAKMLEECRKLNVYCPQPSPNCRYIKDNGSGRGKCRMKWCCKKTDSLHVDKDG